MSTALPKGKLMAIGGNEDKGTYPNPRAKRFYRLNFFELGILKRFLQELKKKTPRIEIITTASLIPLEVGDRYLNAFKLLNIEDIGFMHIDSEEEARKPEYLERLKSADGVMFTGGDQSRITQMFLNTDFLDLLKLRYLEEENFVIAGTSAGAMAMSEIMVRGGSVANALLKGSVKMGTGLGLIRGVIIDSHFVKRGRFGRLIEAVALHDKVIGIGLGEDTGVLITKGHFIETIGSNLVIIIDGHHIQHNNAPRVDKGTPLSIENVELHVLAKGNVYDMSTREFYADFEDHQEWLNSQAPPELRY
ncbi:cyanophycinase [Adhaeribacter soli]|uniref:Cyanophycinase n=1 Tax=Adhaeribacter soli TaxID=2607655 RepID=A0A5N1J743_9BACT|nr:cyanophycinase [Adhaeribacter soli]KAA9345933.1 cyanophycinase [Adhaeribacter soli]